jgi:hypothetical protein
MICASGDAHRHRKEQSDCIIEHIAITSGNRPSQLRSCRSIAVDHLHRDPVGNAVNLLAFNHTRFRDLAQPLGVFGLRFLPSGPPQRTDMAIAKFTQAIVADKPITLSGEGARTS